MSRGLDWSLVYPLCSQVCRPSATAAEMQYTPSKNFNYSKRNCRPFADPPKYVISSCRFCKFSPSFCLILVKVIYSCSLQLFKVNKDAWSYNLQAQWNDMTTRISGVFFLLLTCILFFWLIFIWEICYVCCLLTRYYIIKSKVTGCK